MEFRETLLAAQRNAQQKSNESLYYKARFDPPKKEQKQKDRLSANIQKFLAKKDEEEKQKKLEAQRKRDELLAMRDPKAIRKIQKSLKVFKSANKSVLADAVDREHTAVTREGPDQPDQDDYGYESQEAAAIYQKMMEKYSQIPDEPKFPKSNQTVKRDLNGTRERVKHALQHEDDPVPHKRRRRTDNGGTNGEREPSPPTKQESDRKKDDKTDKPKVRKPLPPPMDFNQLLKLAEQKKSEPLEVATKKVAAEPEPERLMTKKQKREYEEEMARRQRRQERLEAEKSGGRKVQKEEKPVERERKPESSGFGRIPKIGDKVSSQRNDSPKPIDKEKERLQRLKEKAQLEREKLEKLKAERERIDRDIERLNKDKERLDKTKLKLETAKPSEKSSRNEDRIVDRSKLQSREDIKQDAKKSIDLKSQNTYRIDKNSNDKKFVIPNKSSDRPMNGHSSTGKPVPKLNKDMPQYRNGMKDKVLSSKQDGPPRLNGQTKPENGKRMPETSKISKLSDERKPGLNSKPQSTSAKPKISNSFDFDKHVNSLGKNGQRSLDKNGARRPDGTRQFPPGDVKRKPQANNKMKMKRRAIDSDSEYDSEMDDFIDDGDENMDYSRHIKEIFGYDKSKYQDIDDDDDPMMESSFAVQQREEYISKKIGIMEDLEDMRMEALEKNKAKKRRRISDD